MTKSETALAFLHLIQSQRFADWYGSTFEDYTLGVEPHASKIEILRFLEDELTWRRRAIREAVLG